jgi:nitrogen PTS system EIIA component
MQPFKVLPEAQIRCHLPLASKKRVLEQLSELLCAEEQDDISQESIFDALLARERLGTTGFGNGVAIPHGRISGLDAPILALVTLKKPIDFDSIDLQPVDLLIAMIVPEDDADTHIALLSQIADMLRNSHMRGKLRAADSAKATIQLIKGWNPTD